MGQEIKGETMTPDDVMEYISSEYGFSRDSLRGDGRAANIVRARHIGIFLMMDRCGLSSNQAGKIFNRDHTTALMAYHKIRGLVLDGIVSIKIKTLEPKISHQIKFDKIIDDSFEIIKVKLERALDRHPLETMIGLCALAKRLDKMNNK